MVKYQTVRAADLDVKKLTFEDLRYLHGTGRSYVISGTGHDRKTGYRTGVQTNVGDIEVSEWKELMKELIHRSGEDHLYRKLFQWVSQTTPWLHTKQEYELQALELHSARIFENPNWADYEAFKKHLLSIQTGGELVD